MNAYELTSQLKEIYGDHLESVILYGSAADGEFHKGHSDYNIIIVLKNMAPMELAKSNKLMKKWIKDGNPMPLFFNPQTISEASDVFPIEFIDIIERHKLLYGTDLFLNMKIDTKNLRHQCEHELRSKLMALEQRFVLVSGEPKKLIKLIIESSSSFFAIFGGIARLAGIRPEASKKALAEQIAKLVGADMSIFMEIVEVREDTRVWRKEEAVEKFEQYLTSIQGVVRYADKANSK